MIMIKINLLPKEYQKRKFSIALEKNALYVIGGGVAALILLAAYSIFFQVIPISSLDKKIQDARADAAKYDSEIKLVNQLNDQKDLILTRMGTIEQLDQNREAWVNLVSDLGSRMTDYLWLIKFGNALGDNKGSAQGTATSRTIIEGRSFSINSLATFLVRLKRSPFLDKIDLVSVLLEEEKDEMGGGSYEAYHFVIHCDLVLEGMNAVQMENKASANKLAAGSEF